MKLKVKYNKVYLVGYDANRSSAHRVTSREGLVKPKEIRFSGNVATEVPDTCYGVLELTEDLWHKWFDDCSMLPNMATIDIAAETLIKEPGIFYGCPLCSFHLKDRMLTNKHVQEHVNKFVTQFDFEVEETNDTIVKE